MPPLTLIEAEGSSPYNECIELYNYTLPFQRETERGIKVLWYCDSKMTFKKHLRSVSRAASQRLGILRKSWRMFFDRSLLGRCFLGFVLPVLEYFSAVWCSTADTHLKLLDRAVSGARFLTGSVFECDISHRRSVAVLCMLYKIRCNPVHPLNGALPGPYVTVCASGRTSVHLCTASLQNLAVQQDFYFLLGVLLERSCLPRYRWCRTGEFQEQGQYFFIALNCSIPTIVFYSFSFSLLLSISWYCGAEVFGLIGFTSLSLSLALPTFFNNNNND